LTVRNKTNKFKFKSTQFINFKLNKRIKKDKGNKFLMFLFLISLGQKIIRAFLFCVAWLAATTRGSAVPLHHIKSLMAPPTVAELRAISTHGRFERVVDEPDDLAGGRTNARLAARVRRDSTRLFERKRYAMRRWQR
jgi:hypothetical protein